MTLQALIDHIEGISFDANMNVFSGFSTFYWALQQEDVVKQLEDMLRASLENRNVILQRLLELLGKNDEPEYAHPFDVAIATYLHTLYRTDPALTRLAVDAVLQTPRLFWTRRLAEAIRQQGLEPVEDSKRE